MAGRTKIEVGDYVRILDPNGEGGLIEAGMTVQVKCISHFSDGIRMYVLDGSTKKGAICDCGKHRWILENKHVMLVEKAVPSFTVTSDFDWSTATTAPWDMLDTVKSINKSYDEIMRYSLSPWSMTESIKNIKEYNKTKMHSSFTDKMSLMFKSEPEKSYRKAGIINGDDIITDQGAKIFLTWLLKKNPEFKAEVVDPILSEDTK